MFNKVWQEVHALKYQTETELEKERGREML
jgi:hypothetical protein